MRGRLGFALKRYEQICSKRPGEEIPFAGEAFGSWIRDDVCPAVQQLLDRADFRRLARWPLDHLSLGARTPERQLVENVERELVAAARRLTEIVNVESVRTALNRKLTTNLSTLSRAGGAAEPEPSALEPQATVADLIAKCPWQDLVSIYDYFGPAADFNLKSSKNSSEINKREPQWAIFTPYFAPDLRLPGDFITRMLRIRIEHWYSNLQKLSVRCEAIHRQQNAPADVQEARRTCFGELPVAIQQLEATVVYGPQVKLRQACMALVQLYAAYHAEADLGWLGPAAAMKSGAAGIAYWIEKRENQELVDRIAGALAEVAEFAESPVPPNMLIDERILDTPLVLVQTAGRDEIYWQGNLLEFDVDRSRAPWTLLVALVRKARCGQAVDETDDLGISLKDAKHRLKPYLPPELFKLIKSTRHSHRLELGAEHIFAYPKDLSDHATRTTYGGA